GAQGGKKKEQTDMSLPSEDTLYPVSKESAIFSFSMEMRREEDLEENGVERRGGKEDGVSRGGGTFRQLKSLKTAIEHVPSHRYLKRLCSQRLFASPNPEEMTIYLYKSTSLIDRGMPVVLNFSKSNCFLRCCKEGERVFLQVEMCEKKKLKKISMNDENTLSFLFYMRADHTRQRRFESALHGGWFIQINTTNSVEMATMDGGMEEEQFLFVIQTNQ
ncbi:hypothetical protein NQZ68_033444, partial [Dissostichus eleginoides]